MFVSKKKFNELAARVDAIETTEPGKAVALDEDEKLRVAYALNVCAVSISQIIDYDDLIILEQEYDAILNNLNLQTFKKHDALLKVLKNILDTVNYFRIQEGDKRFIEKEYRKNIKNAIWKAVPNISIIVSGNPVTAVIAAISQVGISYMNYRDAKSEALANKEKREWELQRAAMEQFHGLRRDLFETAWRLSEEYNFEDKYRLTEKQLSHYCSILRDPDPLRRYEKLDAISGAFEAFPLYWYYRGRAAMQVYRDETKDDYTATYKEFRTSFKDRALEAFGRFEDIHGKVQFFREDVLAAACAIDHISLLDAPKYVPENKKKIEGLLEKALRLAPDNFEIMQMCVMIRTAILNQPEEAEHTLRRLVNEDYNISVNGPLLSRVYYLKSKRPEHEMLGKRIGEENVFPWEEDAEKANAKYLESRQDKLVQRYKAYAYLLARKHRSATVEAWGYKLLESNYNPGEIESFTEKNILESLRGSIKEVFSAAAALPFYRDPEAYGLLLPPSDTVPDSFVDVWKALKEKEKTTREYLKANLSRMTTKEERLFGITSETVTQWSVVKQLGGYVNNLCDNEVKQLYTALADLITEQFKSAISSSQKAAENEVVGAIMDIIDKKIESIKENLPQDQGMFPPYRKRPVYTAPKSEDGSMLFFDPGSRLT